MPVLRCRHFNGYKPCGKSAKCDEQCAQKSIPSVRILFIHLGAIGAVVRSTALLKAIHRKYPNCHLTWVTDRPCQQLLKNHPLLDQVLTTDENDLLELSVQEFDIALLVDKSKKAAAVLKKTHADLIYGFKADPRTGAILPATLAAEELWQIGLSDDLKFHQNKKTELQLVTEALELGKYQLDDYELPLTLTEQEIAVQRKSAWQKNPQQIVIGLNTGASPTIPYKKMTVEKQQELIRKLHDLGYENLVLLGGPEDTQRNQAIALNLDVQQSPTTQGLRDGLVSVSACDVVISGDSLGMHLAIAAKAYVVAWFGPTCAHEIELYNRGEAILSKVKCGPCWKRLCTETTMCYDQVSFEEIITAVRRGEVFCQNRNNQKIQHQEQASL